MLLQMMKKKFDAVRVRRVRARLLDVGVDEDARTRPTLTVEAAAVAASLMKAPVVAASPLLPRTAERRFV